MFKSHKEINNDYRKIILEETGEFKIKDVPLLICSEIIKEYLEIEETFYVELTRFTIEAIKDGERFVRSVSSLKESEHLLDEIIEFGYRKDVIAVIRQNDKVVRGYIKGEFIYPASFIGKLDVKKRVA